MKGRILAAVVIALAWCAPAMAAPATVQLRVEGASGTIYEGPVTTDGKTITKGGNTVECDGSLVAGSSERGPTATTALDDGALAGGFDWDATFFNDFFVSRIGPDAGNANQSWGVALNYVSLTVGGCQQLVRAGDEVLFAFDFFGGPPDFLEKKMLRLAGPGKVGTGGQAAVTVKDGTSGAPFAGAVVGGQHTGPDGTATVTLGSPGLVQLKAEAPGAIRSNALKVCVSTDGTGDCGVPLEQLGTPSASGGGVRDSKAPLARITGLRDGARYARGPRVLRGTASDEGGVSVVKLALSRKVPGENCRWWSGRRERFVGTHCRKVFFFAIGSDADWEYQLPRRLGPGRYTLDVKAFDRVRNRDEKFVRGKNRVVFNVAGKRGRATAARSRGTRVKVMVVGRDGSVLAGARSVRAAAVRVRASGRRCKVNASTPLAALAKSGVRYHVRDFGRCSKRSGRDSGQLFVDRIGGEVNREQDGWVYKVNGRAGTAGAGDPAGPFGAGGLRRGAQVLWFYCVHTDSAGGCQRSLSVSLNTKTARAGERLPVTVHGQDNEGRRQAVGGARVTIGPAAALTDAQGKATLTLPQAGSYRLTATAQGRVPSFPVTLTVA